MNDNRTSAEPVKILHITDQLSKGGAGRALIGVAKYSSQSGNFHHECISVKPLFDGVVTEDVTEGLKVHVSPEPEQFLALYENADIIHWHWWQDFPLMRTKLPTKPTIVWCAVSGEYSPNELTRDVVDFADVMVITNPLTRDLPAIRSLPETERQRKVRIIFESADFDRILPLERIPHDTFNVGWIGTICPGKYNPRYVEMSSKIEIPNVQFMVCGEGTQKEAAVQETARLGIQDRFQFLGYQDDMRRMFGLFDVYGFPLDEKTFAGGELNLQEAMVAALPIVVFPYGGPKRMILHNYNGLIANSEKEYKEAIEFLYHNPGERARLGQNAKDYALREFGAENAARKFNRLYVEMLEKVRQPVTLPQSQGKVENSEKESFKRLAHYHQSRGNAARAAEYAKKALERTPGDPEMLSLLKRDYTGGVGESVESHTEIPSEDIEKCLDTRTWSEYKVTAIVSTYASETVFRGCLTDLYDQTLYRKGDLEIVIVDAASPENEWSIVEEFTRNHQHILALRTKERESLYAAWNRAVRLARGQYVTNANTDDRHRRDALEVLARTLDENPGVALAYGDVLITEQTGETFEKNSAQSAFRWGEYSQEKLEDRCCVGPQPMWRRSLYDEIGFFDERYVSAGDYDFWLRISMKYPLIHVDEILGLYLDNPGSLEHQGLTGHYERIDVQNSHALRKMPPLKEQPLVSVIIPTLNRKHLLNHTLQSLIDQSYQNWEALIINDGGEALTLSDGLPDDGRIRITNLPENHERSYCRNLGIKEAKGEYIAFLDDDDVFYRHHLDLMLRTAQELEGEYKILYASSYRAWSKIVNGELKVEKIVPAYGEPFQKDRFIVNNYIPILALLFHRDVFGGGELFDEGMNCLEDLDLLIRLARKYDFHHLNRITHEFRTFEQQDAAELTLHKQNYEKLYERYADLTGGDWETTWKQENWLHTLDMMIFRQQDNLPSVALVIDATKGADILVKTIAEIRQTTAYPKAFPCFVVQETDAASRERLAETPWKDCIHLTRPGDNWAEILNAVARNLKEDLLIFLDAGCVPVEANWILGLVETHRRRKAGIVSGVCLDLRNAVAVRNASIAFNRLENRTEGLYARFPFYHPVMRRERSVDAVGPGFALIARREFLDSGGFDPSLSKTAAWVDLATKMRKELGREVIFNPWSVGHYLDPESSPVDQIGSEEVVKLTERWGDVFLRSVEDWFVQEGFWERDERAGVALPARGDAYVAFVERADALSAINRTFEAILTLEAALQVYPDDDRILTTLQDLVKEVQTSLKQSA